MHPQLKNKELNISKTTKKKRIVGCASQSEDFTVFVTHSLLSLVQSPKAVPYNAMRLDFSITKPCTYTSCGFFYQEWLFSLYCT